MHYISPEVADTIQKIVRSHFLKEADRIIKMATGIDNEVFLIVVGSTEYILRMNTRESLRGSSIHIPLFSAQGIKVPEIIAEDYSQTIVPHHWQILSKIEGEEIGVVISNLKHEELDAIAQEVAQIIQKLIVIPTNGLFGNVGYSQKKMYTSLYERVENMLVTIKKRNTETRVIKDEYVSVFENALSAYESYFKNAQSQLYFDDMSSKNVMILGGKFNGLVDLDYVAYGDYLDLVGCIKASWYGTDYGDYYTKAVMDNLGLTEEQRTIATVWAFLNRLYWQSEIGVKFNENTSTSIDQARVEKGNIAIDGLISELNLSSISK